MASAVMDMARDQLEPSIMERIDDDAWVTQLTEYLGRDYISRILDDNQLMIALNREIARLDQVINEQVNEIIHNERFQALESAWLGIRYLVSSIDDPVHVKVKLLDITWAEIAKDLDRAIEVDQSELFNKIYHREFGMPGGEPYGVLLGNYQVTHRTRLSGQDDVQILAGLSAIAAASFAPFIAGVHPSLIDLEDFSELSSSVNLDTTFQQQCYLKWKSLRKTPDARFLGLTLPRVLIRRPYRRSSSRTDNFVMKEYACGSDRSDYLWMNAVFSFGAVLARCFSQTGWLAEITGVRSYSGGTVPQSPAIRSEADGEEKMPCEVLITDELERELTDYGFIPLSFPMNGTSGVFYSAPSIQNPRDYAEKNAAINSKYSSMLQYVFCTSRFSHYLKVIVRDKIGSFSSAQECRDVLQNWILNYVMSTDDASDHLLTQYPLRDARITVYEQAGLPGSYYCIAHIKPHLQIEAIETAIHFVAEVVPARVTG